TCSVCRQITDGRSLDVVEIDAASNGRVDDARDLRDQINFAPNEAKYKFYIIDEAHQITKDAFDALLKTFEEPPAHVIFVLATTDPNKVPPTILSRCQRFDFRRISVADLRASLTDICAAEGLEAEPAALEVLARAADGSSRDSQSLLDQAIAFCGSSITLAGVRGMLGLASADTIERLAEALLSSDARTGLELINDATDAGVDPRGLNRELVEHLRTLLLLKVSSDTAATLDVAPEALPALSERAGTLSTASLVRQIKIFSEADYGFRSALQPQLPLELGFLQAIDAATLPSPSPAAAGEGTRTIASPSADEGRGTTASPSPAAPGEGKGEGLMPAPGTKLPEDKPVPALHETRVAYTPPKAPEENLPEIPPQSPESPLEITAQSPTDPPDIVAESPPSELDDSQILETITARWANVLQTVGATSKNLLALLRSCAPSNVEGATLILLCEAEFHAGKISEPANKRLVEGALSRALGRPCYVKCVVREKKTDATKQLTPGQADTAKPDEDDPLVRAALRMLNARVLENN
ncbi:MAG TPA: DNA polymerase III subunit gamma/tau, partial [Chloroflexota bacterium]|nr:DNA polymerase III subunit gamma/tau [Chloroflexota bacterium]